MASFCELSQAERRSEIDNASNHEVFKAFEQAFAGATENLDWQLFDLALEFGAELTVSHNNPRWETVDPEQRAVVEAKLTQLDWFPEMLGDQTAG